jgi:hypothetical protein
MTPNSSLVQQQLAAALAKVAELEQMVGNLRELNATSVNEPSINAEQLALRVAVDTPDIEVLSSFHSNAGLGCTVLHTAGVWVR